MLPGTLEKRAPMISDIYSTHIPTALHLDTKHGPVSLNVATGAVETWIRVSEPSE